MEARAARGVGSPSALDRFLRIFSEVRTGEGSGAVLLALNVFLILTAYYILKPVREALIIGQGSAELKSYMSAGQVGLLSLLVPLYGRLAGRLPRRKLINWVTAFFVLCLIGFFLLARAGVPIGIPFFLWIGIFNLMIVAQFWSFANDVYTEDEGERLFPIVAFGASAGAVLGAVIAGQLIEPLGINQLLLTGAAILVLAVQITNYVDSRERRRTEWHLADDETTASIPSAAIQQRLREIEEEEERRAHGPAAAGDAGNRPGSDPGRGVGPAAEAGRRQSAVAVEDAPAGAEDAVPPAEDVEPGEAGGAGGEPSTAGAFALVFRNRYLLFIGLILLLLNWVNTTGEYILGSVVERAAREAVSMGAGVAGGLTVEQYIGEFYSGFFSIVNLAGLLIQLFIVSRVIKYIGGFSIAVLPVISFFAYGLLAFFPVLAAVRWAKIAENSTDYSLNNTARNMLFLPTSRADKYAAKQAIDSFFVRAGDVLSALAVFVGTTFLALGPGGFARFNLVLVGVWLVIAVAVARGYRRRVRPGESPGRA